MLSNYTTKYLAILVAVKKFTVNYLERTAPTAMLTV
jgi:hypothetical protein